MNINTLLKATVAGATLLIATSAANAGPSCLNDGTPGSPPAALKPLPGEIYGCPVYARISNGLFWFSNFVQPFDNNLYGFVLPTIATNGTSKTDQVNQITAITAQNWALTQFGNAFQNNMALAGVTFTPTGTITGQQPDGSPLITGGQTFQTPDGTVNVIHIDIRQGF